jgi:hypothetical protein
VGGVVLKEDAPLVEIYCARLIMRLYLYSCVLLLYPFPG